jgi:hypothetical protein
MSKFPDKRSGYRAQSSCTVFRLRSLLISALLLVMIPFLCGVTIRVKISAPGQALRIKLSFPKKEYGLGASFPFFVQIVKPPGSSITNIRVIENYDFDTEIRQLRDVINVNTSLSELAMIKCHTRLLKSGIYSYTVEVTGMNPDHTGFFRSTSQQIHVDQTPDPDLDLDLEVGPYLLNSSGLILNGQRTDDAARHLTDPHLQSTLRALRDLPEQFRVIVTGFADMSVSGTNTQNNITLSSNRARTVVRSLCRTYSLPPYRFVVRGLGSAEEKYPDKPGATLNRNRRVSIVFP